MWEIKKNLDAESKNRFYIKMGDSKKKCCKYKTGDKYCNLYMEKELAIASDNKPNKLLHQKSEILIICWHKKISLLGR